MCGIYFSSSLPLFSHYHPGHLAIYSVQGDERCRLGSSFNTSRVNAEAESLATEARVLKKAKQHKRAHDMYTRAIELDRFNHTYFHHRAETALNWKQYELGVWDAQ